MISLSRLFRVSTAVFTLTVGLAQTGKAIQPTLYYTFDEGSGSQVANLGSLGGNGTIQGSLAWTTGAPNGATPAGGITFNGSVTNFIATGFSTSDLGVNHPVDPVNTLTDYTCAAWCWLSSTNLASAGDNMVFGSEGVAGANWLHNGFRNAGAHMGHYGNDSTGGTMPSRTWIHVAWRYQGGVQEIYVNGNRVAGPNARGTVRNVTPAYIGRASTSRSFNGVIDEVAVFNTALSISNIRRLAAGASPLSLTVSPLPDGEFYTAPLGPAGTWNLYKVVGRRTGTAATWHQAHLAATGATDPSGLSTNLGHLVSIGSLDERRWLVSCLEGSAAWIGLCDIEEFGGAEAGSGRGAGWVWAGTTEPYSYQSWNTGEPNNATAAGEDAVEMLASGLWNDTPSGVPSTGQTNAAPTRVYVIEWETGSPDAVPGAIPATAVLPENLPGPEGVNGRFGVLEARNPGLTVSGLASALAILNAPGTVTTSGRVPLVNFQDPQGNSGSGLFTGNVPFLSNTAADDNHFIAVCKAFVTVPADGVYTFGVRSDDGFALRIRGREWLGVSSPGDVAFVDFMDRSTVCYPVAIGDANTHARIQLEAGTYALELVYFEIAGGAYAELYAAPGAFLNATDTGAWRLVGYHAPGDVVTPALLDIGGGKSWTVLSSHPNGAAINGPDYIASARTEAETDTATNNTWAVINFSDPQSALSAGSITGDSPFDNNTPAADDQFAIKATATLLVPAGGATLRLGFQSDDGSQLRVVGRDWDRVVFSQPTGAYTAELAGDRMFYNLPTGNSRTIGEITLPEGSHAVEYLMWENGGGAYAEVFFENSHHLLPSTNVVSSGLLATGVPAVAEDFDGLAVTAEPDIRIAHPDYDALSGTINLTWPSVPGSRYDAEWSTDYSTWNPLATGVAANGGSATTITVGDNFPGPFVVFRVTRVSP